MNNNILVLVEDAIIKMVFYVQNLKQQNLKHLYRAQNLIFFTKMSRIVIQFKKTISRFYGVALTYVFSYSQYIRSIEIWPQIYNSQLMHAKATVFVSELPPVGAQDVPIFPTSHIVFISFSCTQKRDTVAKAFSIIRRNKAIMIIRHLIIQHSRLRCWDQ